MNCTPLNCEFYAMSYIYKKLCIFSSASKTVDSGKYLQNHSMGKDVLNRKQKVLNVQEKFDKWDLTKEIIKKVKKKAPD